MKKERFMKAKTEFVPTAIIILNLIKWKHTIKSVGLTVDTQVLTTV